MLVSLWKWAGVLLGIVVSLCAHANVDEMANSLSEPQKVIKQASDQVIHVLTAERESFNNDPGKVYDLVNEYILPHFDFELMSYYVLGGYWKNASEQQKVGFQTQFRRLLVRTYATAFSDYKDEKIEFLSDIKTGNEDHIIVQTKIHQKGASPIAVAYRMINSGNTWKIYDVSIGGVSLVTNYRANFSGQVRRKGLDKLIESLAEHNKPVKDQPVDSPK
ncbi:MAG: ABC transporter substrate-binding protein [Gammaproteobacteria bacterium]|nr:MAG: ABC transporter substrate-binding protein [Gammaproteobacteria bacterium]